jgi:hypothetical protein
MNTLNIYKLFIRTVLKTKLIMYKIYIYFIDEIKKQNIKTIFGIGKSLIRNWPMFIPFNL